jgi:DNA-binding response OmpR family regulator
VVAPGRERSTACNLRPDVMTARILIVEPDDRLRESLHLHLSLEGYECDAHQDLGSVDSPIAAGRIDLAVVNLVTTRRHGGPRRMTDLAPVRVSTLLLAGPGRHDEALVALEQWADDYVTLPVEMRELVARAHALIRRRSVTDGEAGKIVHDGLLIDPSRREVNVDGRALQLTRYEFQLLQTLAKRPGVVFPRAALLSELWGAETFAPLRSVDALVMRVRRQMRTVPSGWHIATVRGIGYQFKAGGVARHAGIHATRT